MRLQITGAYPVDWPEIANNVKTAANWQCIRCGHAHDPKAGRTLTVHHFDGNKTNCRWWNLLPLCQACHLSIQARVMPDRPWVMTEHSEWFKPFVAGFYAWKYLGIELSREAVVERLEELLRLERDVVLGATA